MTELNKQAEEVWSYLKSGRALTPLIASTTMQIMSLTSRISEIRRSATIKGELRALNKVLVAETAWAPNGKRYKKYFLRDKEEGQ